MFSLVLLIAIGCLGTASCAPNSCTMLRKIEILCRSDRPAIPSSISLRPTTVKITNTAGSGSNKEQQFGVVVVGPYQPENSTCTCPGHYGWHDDDIKEIHSKTNLQSTPYDCFCYGPNGYFLQKFDPPLIIAEDCRCPSSRGWSQAELLQLQNVSKLNGNQQQCFCSSRQGYTVNYLQPASDVEEFCQCPISRGWTPDELEQHFLINNIKGGMYDCFCYSTHGYVLKQKQISHGVVSSSSLHRGEVQGFLAKPQLNQPSITEIHGPVKECTHCQLGPAPSVPISNSRLVLLSLDGKMKEFLLGPMSVKFHK